MKKLFYTLYICLIAGNVLAADISVRASIDSSSLLIGNPTNLRFSVSQPTGKFVQFPIFADTIAKGIDIIEKKKPDTVKLANNQIEVRQDYTVSVFDSGEYKIPPVKFILNNDTFAANALMIKGVSVPVDTVSMDFRDIKPIMELPFDWVAFFKKSGLVSLILLVLAAIVYALVRFMKKKPILPAAKPEVQIPAHITALQALDKIKAEKLWQHGREKDFHTQLTDVVRAYIDQRFGINAMEMTSEDILQHLKQQNLKQVLQAADLVKFAKQKMLPNENDLCLENAYSFINETKEEI
ncbi:MAG: BatD family protein [Prevotellaceae bacterium]|jgi:hypothetical protein|nr:BatD family protein [Prevotellaceae bacterium]